MSENKYIDNVLNFKNNFLEFKKYWIIYLIFITICFFSTLSQNSFSMPYFVGTVFLIVALLGISCIIFYFSNNDDHNLYKVAFIVILCFGICASLIVPISDVSDETEHFCRSELTSQGIIFPHWTGEDVGLERTFNLTNEEKSTAYNSHVGYESIESSLFYIKNLEQTVFDVDDDTDKIDYKPRLVDSAFEQNPFYGYLPQALGILLAKILDLNVIWMLWLGRIFNLLSYSLLASYAIKKATTLKMPLFIVACIPASIYQAASMSIDSMIFGLGLLAIAYFIYMCTSNENEVGIKDIVIFSIICLLLGLCKMPYLAFIFLLLFIPKKNFDKDYHIYRIIFIAIGILSIIGIIYSSYSTPTLLHSWRSAYTQINSSQQLNFLLSHPNGIFNFLQEMFSREIFNLSNTLFNFYGGKWGSHYSDKYTLISSMLFIFLSVTLLTYPLSYKFKKISKIGSAFTVLVVYIGVCFIQLLTWAPVGKVSLGITIRYFIPLIAFIPIIFGFNYNIIDKQKYDKYSIILIVGFLSAMILAFATKYY